MAEILKPFGEYKTPGISEDVVSILKNMLERAEAGEIVSIALSAISQSGLSMQRYATGTRGMGEMLGGVTVLAHMIADEWRKDG